MSAKSNAPVIIKRRKIIAGGGHHGGAWKVAYADFVTAMMAFFMLMWLLNATTEKQRKGIADYFNPTIPINRISGGGEGSFGGTNIFSEETLARNGTGATSRHTAEEDKARGDTGTQDTDSEADQKTQALQHLSDMLTGKSGESMVSELTARHIVTRLSDEGLIVEIFELPGVPLFDEDSAEPTQLTRELMTMMASVFGLVTNEIAVNGYTAAQPAVLRNNPVWDLSADRADQVRRLLQGAGLPPQRVQRISGFADRKPVAANPMAVRNNRIEMILLRDKL